MVYSLVPRRRQHSFAETSVKTLNSVDFTVFKFAVTMSVPLYPCVCSLSATAFSLGKQRGSNELCNTVVKSKQLVCLIRKTTLCSPLQKTSHMLYWKAEKKIPEQNKLGHNISSYCLSLYHVIQQDPFPKSVLM